jgi:pyruvate kinase
MSGFAQRRTKIVCTLGPATDSSKNIERLVAAGMNCARLNFSHGTLEEHSEVITRVRQISKKHEKPISIMQDLPGAKIRVGKLRNGAIELRRGDAVSLVSSNSARSDKTIPIRATRLIDYVPVGASIYLSDGLIRLRVTSKTASVLNCRCQNGGRLLSGKGVNIPDLAKEFQGFTAKDQKFLEFGLDQGVDLVAVSFVQGGLDIRRVKQIVQRKLKTELKRPWIIAKIERKEALRNLDEIIDVSDGVMVARGDLGVENPIEQVPIIQKIVISKCNAKAVPVITATQMLESMVENPRPTRAEASDAANAVLDGTDALMLSEETAIGSFPVECVRTLDRIARSSEDWIFSNRVRSGIRAAFGAGSTDALPSAASSLSEEMHAALIVCPTSNGRLARRISRERSAANIVSLVGSAELYRKLAVKWGVSPVLTKESSSRLWDSSSSTEQLGRTISRCLLEAGFGKKGDKIVIARDASEGTGALADLLLTTRIQN